MASISRMEQLFKIEITAITAKRSLMLIFGIEKLQ